MKIKRFILVFLLLISNIYAQYFTQSVNLKKSVSEIALLSSNSVYQLDTIDLETILKIYLKDKYYSTDK